MDDEFPAHPFYESTVDFIKNNSSRPLDEGKWYQLAVWIKREGDDHYFDSVSLVEGVHADKSVDSEAEEIHD
jgi:hypothetical protein